MIDHKFKKNLTNSSRLLNLEREMFDILKKETSPMRIKDLKDRFPYRASIETTKNIAFHSDFLNLLDTNHVSTSRIFATIKYTMKDGEEITEMWIGDEPANPEGGLVGGIAMGPYYEFQLRVRQSSAGKEWTFNTEFIKTTDGEDRSLRYPPIKNNEEEFDRIIETI